jgi:ribosomal protein S18 acetylase RimI-like enzyme
MLRRVDEYLLELARLADAHHLASMSQKLVEAGLRPEWSSARITWHIRHPESIVLVARAQDRPVGFAIMRYSDHSAHLNLLAVDPGHQRRGVARQILTWLQETALTAGIFTIELELRATNAAALCFYRALGYREVERVQGYYQGLENAIKMSTDLRPEGAVRAQSGIGDN